VHYAKQHASDLGHEAEAEVEAGLTADGRATITFSGGTCVLAPSARHLELSAVSQDADGLASVQGVVARHLLRFANDEVSVRIDWSLAIAGNEADPVHPAVADYVLTLSTQPDDVDSRVIKGQLDDQG
jgi:caffeoyl-CoA O-methyltransferase